MKRACQSVEWQMSSVNSQASRRMGIVVIELGRESLIAPPSKQDGCSKDNAYLMDWFGI
jgi:hypothetical protein